MVATKRSLPSNPNEPATKRQRNWKVTGFHDPRRQDRTDSQIMDLINTALPGAGSKVADTVHDSITHHVFKMGGTSLGDFYIQLEANVDKEIPDQLRAVERWLKPGIAMAAKSILDQVKKNDLTALSPGEGPELHRQLAEAEPMLRHVAAKAGLAPGLTLADASQLRKLVEAKLPGTGNLIVSEVMKGVLSDVESKGQDNADRTHARLQAVAGMDLDTQWRAMGPDLHGSIAKGVHDVFQQVQKANTMTRLDSSDFCEQAYQARAVIMGVLVEHHATSQNNPQLSNERSAMIANRKLIAPVR